MLPGLHFFLLFFFTSQNVIQIGFSAVQFHIENLFWMGRALHLLSFLIQDAGRTLFIGTPVEIRRTTGAADLDGAFCEIVRRSRGGAS